MNCNRFWFATWFYVNKTKKFYFLVTVELLSTQVSVLDKETGAKKVRMTGTQKFMSWFIQLSVPTI